MQVHLHENNSESLAHLEANEEHFSAQCLMVWKLLNQGVRLTVLSAIQEYGIASLPRRIKDLEDRNGKKGQIKADWVCASNGKRLYKVWYIDRPKPPTKKEVTEIFDKELKQQTLFP